MDSNLEKTIKSRVLSILKLDTKVTELKESMENGDVSPFLVELFGKKTTLKVKIGQSVQTTMGMSFYEQTCQEIAQSVGYHAETQYKLKGYLSDEVSSYLKELLDDMDYRPNRDNELQKIKELTKIGDSKEYPDSTVDVFIRTPTTEIYIDITTVKPNKKEFRVLKEKLLRWTSYRLSQNPSLDVQAYIAIPYNPESKEVEGINYNRHNKYYDRKDILVGDELWKIVSGGKVGIADITSIFFDLGSNLSDELNNIIDSA